jgi:hypothetical protein
MENMKFSFRSLSLQWLNTFFDKWIPQRIMQVKTEFDHGPMIFDSAILLEEILSFCSLSFVGYMYKVIVDTT